MRSNIQVSDVKIPVDKEGYLINLKDWNPEVANHIALSEGIKLTDEHWEIVNLLRAFYDEFNLSPAMRPLIKYTSKKLEQKKANSIYLMTLFPGSPAKLGAKIAGLPRPANCL